MCIKGIMISFIRLQSYTEESGHFNTLLRTQWVICEKSSESFIFEDLSVYPKEIRFLILVEKIKSIKPKHVYFEWLHDVTNIELVDSALTELNISWSVTASISELWDENNQDSPLHKQFTLLNKSTSLAAVFVWDDLLVKKLSYSKINFVTIPQYEDLARDETEHLCCSWVADAPPVIIGIVGQLYGYRGVSNLIHIAAKRRNIGILLWGQARWHTISRLDMVLLFRFIGKRRKFISSAFQTKESDFNHVFSHITALYIDGSQYRSPSGVVTRARALGIPVLVESGIGYLQEKSRKDAGIITDSFSKMSKRSILLAINQAKHAEASQVPTKMEQQMAFMNIWRSPNE